MKTAKREDTAFIERINARAEKIRDEILTANTMVNLLRKSTEEDLSKLSLVVLKQYGLENFGKKSAMNFFKKLVMDKKKELKASTTQTA